MLIDLLVIDFPDPPDTPLCGSDGQATVVYPPAPRCSAAVNRSCGPVPAASLNW